MNASSAKTSSAFCATPSWAGPTSASSAPASAPRRIRLATTIDACATAARTRATSGLAFRSRNAVRLSSASRISFTNASQRRLPPPILGRLRGHIRALTQQTKLIIFGLLFKKLNGRSSCASCRSGRSRPSRRSSKPARSSRLPPRSNMTPAALTARLRAWRTALGMRLFDRTPVGHAADQGGRGGARRLPRGRAGGARTSPKRCGRSPRARAACLSVGAVSTAKYFAPRLIAAFVGSRPRIELRF